MIVILDRQHAGKPGKLRDRGAWADMDGDGRQQLEETEAAFTLQYIAAAEFALMRLGYDVMILSDGWYKDRHVRANGYGAGVYVACHLNAGAPKSGQGRAYGAVFYDHRSGATRGPALADSIAAELGAACPELGAGVRVFKARPDDWTKNAYYTIKGVQKPVGICYEPAFMDAQNHRDLFTPEGMSRIGVALADGIDAWYRARAVS